MSKIYVNIDGARNSVDAYLPGTKSKIETVRTAMQSTKNSLYGDVLNRNGIQSKFKNITNELAEIEYKINLLSNDLKSFLQQYENNEKLINSSLVKNKLISVSPNSEIFNNSPETDSNDKDEHSIFNEIREIINTFLNELEETDDLLPNILKLFISGLGAVDYSKISQQCNEDEPASIKKMLSAIGNVLEKIGTKKDNDELSAVSPVLKYIGELYSVYTGKCESGYDIVSSISNLGDKSINVFTGLFDYFTKTLHPYEAVKLYDKFGSFTKGATITGNLLSFIAKSAESMKVFYDPNAKGYEKAGEYVGFLGEGMQTIANTYIASDLSSKVLKFVAKTPKGVKNQILASPELQFVSENASKISKYATWLKVGDVVVSTFSGGIKEFGRVYEDGHISMADIGSIGMYASCEGLSAVVSGLTLGIVDFDGESFADNLSSDVNTFLQGDSWAANFINDKDNWAGWRYTVSMGAGTYIFCENVVDGAKELCGNVAEGANAVAGWISDKWNSIF